MPLDMPPQLPDPLGALHRSIDVEYEFKSTADFLGSDPDSISFGKGDIDIHFGIEFAGNSHDPLTIISAFWGWIQAHGDFDIAVTTGQDVSVGLGAEFFYGRPLLHQSVVEWRTVEQELLEWKALETGFIPRVTVHLQEVSYVDVYAVAFIGPTFGRVEAELESRQALLNYSSFGLRGGLGIGGQLVAKYGLLFGGELRYQMATRFKAGKDLVLFNDLMEPVAHTQIERHQRGPRGFSWVFHLGIRL